ncbi:MAG: histidinol-phosphatase [Bacillota bacterium]
MCRSRGVVPEEGPRPRLDYHIHPDFSTDAAGGIQDYCRAAIRAGLEEICFTTHLDLNPARPEANIVRVAGKLVSSFDPIWFQAYADAVEEARRRYPGLCIRLGLEVDYVEGLEDEISRFTTLAEVDFVLGSVHYVDGLAITDPVEASELWRRYRPGHLLKLYYDLVAQAAASGLFDVLGHLDVYHRYSRPAAGNDLAGIGRQLAGSALATAARHGVGLEVNTSPVRLGGLAPFPGRELLAKAVRAGVRVFTVGSDAHRPEGVGGGVGYGLSWLRWAGIGQVARFHARQATLMPISELDQG